MEDKSGWITGCSVDSRHGMGCLDCLPDWVWEIDAEGNFVYSNRVVRKLLGYSPDEVIGKSLFDLIAPEFTDTCREHLAEARQVKRPIENIRTAFIGKEGLHKDISISCIPLFAGEEVCGFRGTSRDITDMLAQERAVKELETNYRVLLDNSPMGIFILQNERVVYANPTTFEVMGYSPDEVLGAEIWQFVHPDDRDRIKDLYARRMSGQESPPAYDVRAIAKSGEICYFELRATPIIYHGAHAVIDSIVDVTERVHISQELAHSRERYKELVEYTSDWIWEVDENDCYVYSSPRVKEMLGYDPEELIGKTPFDMMPPDEAKKVTDAYHTCAAKREPFALLENVNLHKDGHLVVVETSGVPMYDMHGNYCGYRGIDRDITERKRYEEQLTKLNDCFLNFSADAMENINSLTALAGELLGATTALYNRLDQGMLYSWGQWNTPPDYNPVDNPEGHICYDVIKAAKEEVVVVNNLPQTHYFKTDPNVAAFDLQTYVGRAVKVDNESVGSLCCVFQKDYKITESDERILGIIASGIAVEEKRRRAELELRSSEQRIRSLFESVPAGIGVIDSSGLYTYTNIVSCEMMGMAPNLIIGRKVDDPLWGFIHEDGSPYESDELPAIISLRTGKPVRGVIMGAYAPHYDAHRWLLVNTEPVKDPETGEVKEVIISFIDITDRKKVEFELTRVNRALRVLSEGNQIMVRVNSEQELLNEVCRVIVEAGNYRMAWVGFAEDDADKTVRPVASHGYGTELLDSIKVSWADNEYGRRPTGTAIRTAKPSIVTDISSDERYKDIREKAVERGYLSSISLPLRADHGAFGALTIFASDPHIFDPEEIKLLQELADDLAYGINALRTREEHDRYVEELARLKHQNELILNAAGEGIYGVDTSGRITFINPAAAKMLGYEPDEMLGKNAHALFHYANADGLQYPKEECGIYSAYKDGKAHHLTDEVFWRKDGVSFPIECVSTPIQEDGEMVGAVVIFTDISERKAVENALIETESKYRSLVEESLVGVYIIQESRLVYVNPRCAEIFGYTPEEIVNVKPLRDLTAPEDRDRVAENLRKRIDGEIRSIHYEFKGIRKDGTIIDVEVFGSRTIYHGKPAVIGTLLDVTERECAEVALRESEEKYRLLIERSPDIVIMLKGEHITEVNPAISRTLGYNRSEVIGLTPWDISSATQSDGVKSEDKAKKYIALARSQGPQTFEWVHKHKDGSMVYCEVSLVVYRVHGEGFVQAIVRDISERKKAEEHRRRLERHMESQKRQFYRDTIRSVTSGKLDIVDFSDIRDYLGSALLKLNISKASDVTDARHSLEQFALEHGLIGDRLLSFLIGIGEAMTNALKHGVEGRVYAGVDAGSIWVAISDKGKGIESLILPQATLLRGFSTKPSLGLGYSLMLDVADRIMLKTGISGTTVVLFKALIEPVMKVSPELLPDTWDSIPA